MSDPETTALLRAIVAGQQALLAKMDTLIELQRAGPSLEEKRAKDRERQKRHRDREKKRDVSRDGHVTERDNPNGRHVTKRDSLARDKDGGILNSSRLIEEESSSSPPTPPRGERNALQDSPIGSKKEPPAGGDASEATERDGSAVPRPGAARRGNFPPFDPRSPLDSEGVVRVPEALCCVEGFRDAFHGWAEVRVARGFPVTPIACDFAMRELATQPHRALKLLGVAVLMGWRGLHYAWLDNYERGFPVNGRGRTPPDESPRAKQRRIREAGQEEDPEFLGRYERMQADIEKAGGWNEYRQA